MKFQDDISMAHTVLDLFVFSSGVVGFQMVSFENKAGFYRVQFFTLGDWFVLNFDLIF